MFLKQFNFTNPSNQNAIHVSPNTLYKEEIGYGFLTEEVKKENENLQIPEINTGFDLWYWDQGKNLTTITSDETGCFVHTCDEIPLSFKVNVPASGNYLLTVKLHAVEDTENVILFTGRRRFALRKNSMEKGECLTYTSNVNVCDIIPRGKNTRYEDLTLDISIIGKHVRLQELEIKENSTPTIFIAGDSTVTDQSGCYPYKPYATYSGWGQAITSFVTSHVAISNHAHSGLTTESFRSEGHYDIILDSIQPGDYCMFQFAHNDQKLNHLKANEGYRQNLITYINEIRNLGANPILVTPICRNTWRGTDGSYNDLLEEYANACIQIGKEMDVPVVDLHKRSYDFITSLGLEAAKRYFYPGDYTHTNDYGAFLMAHFVALELSEYYNFISLDNYSNWIPPQEIVLAVPPKDSNYTAPISTDIKVNFTDIADSKYKTAIEKLTAYGIIPHDETTYHPAKTITRVEALNMIIKLYGFFATNVYNDMFTDVVGHEWYAGIVECACSNGIFDMKSITNKEFKPLNPVTYKELTGYCVNGYKSRKGSLDTIFNDTMAFSDNHIMSKEEAAAVILHFKEMY